MDRIKRSLVLLTLWLVLLLGGALPVHAAEPPQLLKAESQVALQSDGNLDIKYRLTFREVDVRSGITTIGPFDMGHTILDSTIEEGGTTRPVQLRSQGGNLYGVDFGFNTEPGQDYTVLIHYSAPARLDQTTYKGEAYRVLAWAPFQWALPIEEQIVTFILPIELPADVKVGLYRIAQEALNNITKHAGANRVTITLDCCPSGSVSSNAPTTRSSPS